MGHISVTHRPIDSVCGSMVGFWGAADRTAPFPVVSGCHFVNSHDHIFETHYPIHVMYVHRPYFALGLYNVGHLFRKRGSLADLMYKEKGRKGRIGEIDEKITREEYTLDWSQYKVFLVKS